MLPRAAFWFSLALLVRGATEACDGEDVPGAGVCNDKPEVRKRSLLQTRGASTVSAEEVSDEDSAYLEWEVQEEVPQWEAEPINEEEMPRDEQMPDVDEPAEEVLLEAEANEAYEEEPPEEPEELGDQTSMADVTGNKLLAHWSFDGGWGTRFVKDESGNGNVLTLRRESWVQPWPGTLPGEGVGSSGAIRFFARSFATASNLPHFKALSLWMKRDEGCCWRTYPLVEVYREGTGFKQRTYMRIWFTGHNQLRAYVWTEEGREAWVRFFDQGPKSAGWQHLAISVEGNRFVFYLDGVARASWGIKCLGGHRLSLKIGTSTHWHYSGMFDDLRMYEQPLSAGEVRAIWKAEAKDLAQSLLAEAGPAITLWQPSTSAKVAGKCRGPAGTQERWEVASGPAGAQVKDGAFLVGQGTDPGDWEVRLTCTAGGASHSATTRVTLFAAQKAAEKPELLRTTVEQPFGFPFAHWPARAMGIWNFGGNGKNLAGTQPITAVDVVSGKAGKLEFSADLHALAAGSSLRLRCGRGKCMQLRLGKGTEHASTQTAKWTGITVAFWFKTSKRTPSSLFQKGDFKVALPAGANDGRWHHLAQIVCKDFSRLIVDGHELHFKKPGKEPDAEDEMTFGVRENRPDAGFDGLLDDLAVFGFPASFAETEVIRTKGSQSFFLRRDGNPQWPGGYSTDVVKEYFPDMPLKEDFTGFFSPKPRSPGPPAYTHPRLFFGPQDLPELQRRLLFHEPARAGMEHIRSLLWEKDPSASPSAKKYPKSNITFADWGSTQNMWLGAQWLVMEAFRCLVDADRKAGERLGQQLESLAKETIEQFGDRHARPGVWEDTWRNRAHDKVMRTGMALIYDFLYPYLKESTRRTTRRALSLATAATWSIGMDAVQGAPAGTSNWLPWLTGDMLLNLLAIYKEEGFDEGVFERALGAYRLWVNTGNSADSGASYEGGGQNALTGTKMLALAQNGYPEILASAGARKHVREYLLHTMQPNGYWFEDERHGSTDTKAEMGDVCAMFFAYPGDKVLDYLCRQTRAEALPLARMEPYRTTVNKYNNDLPNVIYGIKSQGPADIEEHAKVALAEEPLTYVAKDLGLMIARSAWGDKDATWLAHNIRSWQTGSHAIPARGGFAFYALGQVWAIHPGGQNLRSDLHNVVLVDGKGQSTAPGKFLEFQDAPEASWSSCDLQWPYAHANPANTSLNEFTLAPSPHKWGELPIGQQPHYWSGIRPGAKTGWGGGPWAKPLNTGLERFQRAFRTVGLVRGAQPYALVIDDFQKDEASHKYAWRMHLPSASRWWNPSVGLFNRRKADYLKDVKAEGSDIVIPALESGGRLLVRLLPGSSEASISLHGSMLQITAQTKEARFRVLLYPLPEGQKAPTTAWDAGKNTLSVGQDSIQLQVTDQGMTKVAKLQVGGKAVQYTRHCSNKACNF